MPEAYYGGGGTIDQARIRAVFAAELEHGKTLFDRYQCDVRQRASTTDLSDLTRQLRM